MDKPAIEIQLAQFLTALAEWGCEDPTEMAEAILAFQRTGYDLDEYLSEHRHVPASEVN